MLSDSRRDQRTREEADLVAQIAAGDLGAPLAELCRRYSGPLYGFGVSRLADTGLADDLVQECFVRLWRTAGRYDRARGSVATYLFTIARSVAIDIRRRPSSRPVDPPPEREIALESDEMARLVDRLTVRDALNSLSTAHREVLLLAHDGGLTQTEIADRLGLPLGTVKTRMFHGLRALRTALLERGFDA